MWGSCREGVGARVRGGVWCRGLLAVCVCVCVADSRCTKTPPSSPVCKRVCVPVLQTPGVPGQHRSVPRAPRRLPDHGAVALQH